jgi:hypothetical protein
MNRREFTASLAALAVTPALPLGTISSAAAAPVITFPPGSYAWAELIARAQNKCSPALLARHLKLDATTAEKLFETMIHDGVLRTPSLAGVAQATDPIGTKGVRAQKLVNKMRRHYLHATETHSGSSPLVKADDPALGCDQTSIKDDPNARTDQSIQESSPTG